MSNNAYEEDEKWTYNQWTFLQFQCDFVPQAKLEEAFIYPYTSMI